MDNFLVVATVSPVPGTDTKVSLRLNLNSFEKNICFYDDAEEKYPTNPAGYYSDSPGGYIGIEINGADMGFSEDGQLLFYFEDVIILNEEFTNILEDILWRLRENDPCTVSVLFDGATDPTVWYWNGEEFENASEIEDKIEDLISGIKDGAVKLFDQAKQFADDKGITKAVDNALKQAKEVGESIGEDLKKRAEVAGQDLKKFSDTAGKTIAEKSVQGAKIASGIAGSLLKSAAKKVSQFADEAQKFAASDKPADPVNTEDDEPQE